MADGAAAAAAAADPAVAPSSRRRVCDGCDRPASVCLCDALPASPLPTRGALVVLQHPTEHKRPKGTGWILPRCVARCVVSRGRRPSPSLRRMLERVLPKRAPVYLLYPLDEAADVDAVDLVAVGAGSTQIEEEEEEEEEADDGDGDATTPSTSTTTEEDEAVADALRDAAYVCVVIDATWKQAREMFHETTSRLPRRAKVVKLPPPPPPPPPPGPDDVRGGGGDGGGGGGVMIEPQEGCVVTAEATARAMATLERAAAAAAGGSAEDAAAQLCVAVAAADATIRAVRAQAAFQAKYDPAMAPGVVKHLGGRRQRVAKAPAPAAPKGEADGDERRRRDPTSSASSAAAAAACRHMVRSGACLYASECRFNHDPDVVAAAERDLLAKRDAALRGEGAPGEKLPGRFGRRHAQRNRNKSGDFRRWLARTFGLDVLSDGGGVLDIAGGKGELAFELQNVTGVPVTVIDPRPMRLDAYVKRFREGVYHRNASPAMTASVRRGKDAALSSPRHLRLFFHENLWRGGVDEGERKRAIEASHALSLSARWSRRGLVEGVGGGEVSLLDEDATTGEKVKVFEARGRARSKTTTTDATTTTTADATYRRGGAVLRQRVALSSTAATVAAATATCPIPTPTPTDDAPIAAADAPLRAADAAACAPDPVASDAIAEALREALKNASVVVGLHPDQATDALVDFALASGKPFAVVPCCTYGADFPKRRTPSGKVRYIPHTAPHTTPFARWTPFLKNFCLPSFISAHPSLSIPTHLDAFQLRF